MPGYFKAGGGGHGGSSGAGAAPAARALIDDDTPTPAHARFSPARLAAVVGVGLLGWALPMAALLAPDGPAGPLPQMAWFFTQAALLTFGGAYAVLPFVVQGAVAQHGWLSATQMMDGLALGETTPGPLIMVVTFVGFLGGWHTQVLGAAHPYAGAALAAVVVTWYTFLPSFVFILAGGPLVEATHGNLRVTAPLTAVSAAVVGVIAHLAGVFGLQVGWPQGLAAAPDLPALAVAAGAALALFRSGRGVMETIGVCALLGLGGRLLLGI